METLKTIALRKSIRSFAPNQITNDELEKILSAGYAAPCGRGAYETLQITVVTNQDFMNKLTTLTAEFLNNPEYKPLYGAPTIIVLSSTDNPIKFSNVASVIENMAIAATDLGLGSLHLWGAFNALRESPELIKELNLPDGFIPQAGIALGYSTEPLDSTFVNQHNIAVNYLK